MKSSFVFAKIIIFLFSFVLLASANHTDHEEFLQCLSSRIPKSIIYASNNPSYSNVLDSTTQNPRFLSSSTRNPSVIVTPFNVSHIQATIYCSKKHGVQIRIRSGGHDYEGLSYQSSVPFFILDLRNINSIKVDAESKSAWVEAGATLGELYYRIAEKSKTLGFPGGLCSTVGVGGQLGGGGYGYQSRTYGLASDNIIDAQLIDARGRILNRKSMGEDLFWAIRGGGAGSFGIVIAWKVRLIDVPSTVTVFETARMWEDNVTKKFVHRYQRRASNIDKDLTIFLGFRTTNTSDEQGNTKIAIIVVISATFHGSRDRLLPLMQKEFPELGLSKEDFNEMSWVRSIVHYNNYRDNDPLEVLLNKTVNFEPNPFKLRSDYVKKPIPDDVLEKLLVRLYEEDVGYDFVEFFPYGGKLSEISESEIPFPHRAGNLYNLRYMASWKQGENTTRINKHLRWVRNAYDSMTPYVSTNPRSAYLNFRDLDIGVNPNESDTTSAYNYIKQASVWGTKYFKNNFYRLVYVKTLVDPTNFFTYEQSIPPILHN
ncbi:cannabidiolic acid synthase-like [Morus notabilis]|uniref:cannabidiolic acid synthase-like n=1 Tax=Morus notabilis TaxID=981085 RepID=UPI000CED2FD9|nr:cannabidiolic acid synthase-like [Morus notabilis]